MTVRIGIPRGLFYFKFHPLWETFFTELSAEIIISPPTNRRILDEGIKCSVDEACLPVKIFHGHVQYLKDKSDMIFIPRFTSISQNEYVCPKFGGLPDMIRQSIKELPPVIDTEINLRKNPKQLFKAAAEIGRVIGADDRRAARALKAALAAQAAFEKKQAHSVMSEKSAGIFDAYSRSGERVLKIALIGHAYNIFDSYANMNLLERLAKQGIYAVTLEMLEKKAIDENAETLSKRLFWYYGRQVVGGTLHIASMDDIDGIIYVMSFGCGVDSFSCDLASRLVRRKRDIPFTVLTIDEHSGEAGIETRIEAFADLIRRKRAADENNVSASWQCIYNC